MRRPRWQHADGHPYDEIDLGFTRFVDEADAAAAERSRERSGRRRRLALFRSRRRKRRAL